MHYPFARPVWFSSQPPRCTSALPLEQDGVQEILSILIDQNTTDDQVQIVFTTLWYIWKARNDARFNSKSWTVWQVHNAVAADINSSLFILENKSLQAQQQQRHDGTQEAMEIEQQMIPPNSLQQHMSPLHTAITTHASQGHLAHLQNSNLQVNQELGEGRDPENGAATMTHGNGRPGNNISIAGDELQRTPNSEQGCQLAIRPTDRQRRFHLAGRQYSQRRSTLLHEGRNFSHAGLQAPRLPDASAEMQHSTTNPLMSPRLHVTLPPLIPGTRCYTDASIHPDSPLQVPRKAGLGVFFLNTCPGESGTIYIKALVQRCTSVLMAEAAALALAARTALALGIQRPLFLSDNQRLVTFLSGNDHTHPPAWNIKSFTQSFVNHSSKVHGRIYKIQRELNKTAHTLATQAFRSISLSCTELVNCTNASHGDSCPTKEALLSVTGDVFTSIAAQASFQNQTTSSVILPSQAKEPNNHLAGHNFTRQS